MGDAIREIRDMMREKELIISLYENRKKLHDECEEKNKNLMRTLYISAFLNFVVIVIQLYRLF
jgi:hypothetical protein